MNHRVRGVVGGGLVVLALALALGGVLGTAARMLVGLPLVLVAPGYAIVAAVFPRRGPGGPETLLFSVGVSLMVATLGGLALNWTPWGLRGDAWVALLGIVILGAGTVAAARRGGLTTSLSVVRQPRRGPRFLRTTLPLLATALVLIVTIDMSVMGDLRQPHKGFTQLWILPANGNTLGVMRLGVINSEARPTTYRLRLVARGRTVREWRALTLAPSATWQATVTLSMGLARVGRAEVILWRGSQSRSVYRRAWYSAVSGDKGSR